MPRFLNVLNITFFTIVRSINISRYLVVIVYIHVFNAVYIYNKNVSRVSFLQDNVVISYTDEKTFLRCNTVGAQQLIDSDVAADLGPVKSIGILE